MVVLLVYRWLLLVAISSLLVPGQNEFELESILNATDEQVQEISRQAVFTNANACESLPNCSLETCFRQPCKPLSRDEIQTLSCLTNTPNSECSPLTPAPNATCNNLSVSKQSSYVRLSPLALETDRQVQTAICAQKALDQKLKQAWESTSKVSQGWIFFGGIEGYLYMYPGRDYTEDLHCSSYDPRTRPWYTYALAVVKSLYIALDTSSSMSNPLGPLSTQNRLNVSKNIITELLQTLTNGDRVAVSKMSGQKIGDQVSVVFEGSLQTSLDGTEVSAVKDALNMTKVDGATSSLKSVFTEALTFFQNSTNHLPVLLLLTDGEFARDTNLTDLAPLLTQLKEQGVVVFVYRIGFQRDNDAFFEKMQPSLNMSFQAVKGETNPLLNVQSYLDYIAWTRFVDVDKKPVWVPMYDSSGRRVISSIFPAFDANQSLIGVSCIDIVADDLVNKLGLRLVEDAVSERSPPPTQVRVGTALPLSQRVSNAKSCNFTGHLTPICPQKDFTTPMTDFVCCGNCSRVDSSAASDSTHSSSSLSVIGIFSGSLLVFILLIGFGCRILSRRRHVVIEDLSEDWVVPPRRITLNRDQGETQNWLSSSSVEQTHTHTVDR